MTKTSALYVYTNGGPSGRVFVGKFTKAFQVAYYKSQQWMLRVGSYGPERMQVYELSAAPLAYSCDIYHPKFSR